MESSEEYPLPLRFYCKCNYDLPFEAHVIGNYNRCSYSTDTTGMAFQIALNEIGVKPCFVTLPNYADEHNINLANVPKIDWASILVIFGYCIILLFTNTTNEVNYSTYMSKCIRELQERAGCDPAGTELDIPFDFPKANAVRTMLGASSHLRQVSLEAENLTEAWKSIDSHSYPQFFKHMASNVDKLKVDISRFPTLIAVAQQLDKERSGPNVSNSAETSTADSNPKVLALRRIHLTAMAQNWVRNVKPRIIESESV
ncbi:hypothetical protein SESBI_18878 [Sesbania bispinosa]|nr:hypothetical protein SESBI_18878 [Sesbania bispinosa]